MSIREYLLTNRADILSSWIGRTFATYPADSVRFFATRSDRFANPVGDTIKGGLSAVFDSLIAGADPERLREDIDAVIRLRSVQNFSAQDAVGFVFALKEIVHASLNGHAGDSALREDLSAFDRRVDQLALLAFDIYMSCREQVYDIRAREEKARSAKLLARAHQIIERHATGQKVTLEDITPQVEGGERQ